MKEGKTAAAARLTRAARRARAAFAFLSGCVFAVGCGDNIPPVALEVTSPTRASQILEGGEVTVRGVARAPTGTPRVRINGVSARVQPDGAFSVVVPLLPGTNVIETVASGFSSPDAVDRRSVIAGEMVAGPSSDGLLVHFGVRGLGRESGAIPTIAMGPIYDAVAQLLDEGVGCERRAISVAGLEAPVERSMYVASSKLLGELLYSPIELSATVDYMDSGCVAQTGTIGFDTLELHWAYELEANLDEGRVIISLKDAATLYDHEFFFTNEGIDTEVFNEVAAELPALLALPLTIATEPSVIAATESWFESLKVSPSVAPNGVALVATREAIGLSTDDGLQLRLSSYVDDGGATTFVPTPAETSRPAGSHTGVAFSDDAINQALGAAWRAGGFSGELPSGGELELLSPPTVRAVAGETPQLVIGDWLVRHDGHKIHLAGAIELVAAFDDVSVGLAAENAALDGQSPDVDGASLRSIATEAETLLEVRVEETLRALALPVAASSAAPDLIAIGQDGHVEVSIDLDALSQ